MDPQARLLAALQHCMPYLAADASEEHLRWRVRLGRLSCALQRQFPGGDCAELRRHIDEADEEALAVLDEETRWRSEEARLGTQIWAELRWEYAHGEE